MRMAGLDRPLRYALIAVVFLGLPAHAHLSLEDYKRWKHIPELKAYLRGAEQGFEWANSWLVTEHRPPIYCQPDKLAITEDQVFSIVEQEIAVPTNRFHHWDEGTPIEVVLLTGLIATFPCH